MSISTPGSTPRLACEDLEAIRGGVPAVRGVDIELAAGDAVGLVGAAGSGKTSVLLALAGLIELSCGWIKIDGVDVTTWPVHERVRSGMRMSSPGVTLVPSLTVAEHIRLAQAAPLTPPSLSVVMPLLQDRLDTAAQLLSGGMQRVLAVAMALAGQPRILMVDDLAEGLQPSVVAAIVRGLQLARADGTAMVLVDRSVAVLDQLCQSLILLENGRPVARVRSPTTSEMRADLERHLL
jgi:branched-chain amino acid transport system ATP-binding protein